MAKLTNKTIWITGASSGIGKELALQLAPFNNNLVLSARNLSALTELKEQCEQLGAQVLVLPLDLSDTTGVDLLVQQVVETYTCIDVLINNGGVSQRALAIETPIDIDRQIMEVNFFGAVALTKAVLPYMLKRKQGNITAMSSLSGKFGWHQRSAYAASKHALQGFFETLGIELKGTGVTTTIISPGRINTPISVNAVTKDGTKHGIHDKGQENGLPVKESVAKIIKAIASDKKELILAKEERVVYWVHRFSSKLFYYLASKVSPKA